MVYVHRLVATAFLANPEKKLTVNHKDTNKLNNLLGNLEWATHTENVQHAIANGLWKKAGRPANTSTPIYVKTCKICGIQYVHRDINSVCCGRSCGVTYGYIKKNKVNATSKSLFN